MCAGTPSLSALGLGGKIFPPSLLLLRWLSGQLGSAGTGRFLRADGGYNCMALVRGCLSRVDWKAGSAEVTSSIPALSLPLLSLFLAALEGYRPVHLGKSATAFPSWRITSCLYVGGGKHRSTKRNIPTRVRAFQWSPRRVVHLQVLPVWIHLAEPALFLAPVEIFANPPRTDKTVYICSVYYAEDTDWH